MLGPLSAHRSALPSRRPEPPLSPSLHTVSNQSRLSIKSSVSRFASLHPRPVSPSRPPSPTLARLPALSNPSAPLLQRRRTSDLPSQASWPQKDVVLRSSHSGYSDRGLRLRGKRETLKLKVRVIRFVFRLDDVLGQGNFGTAYAGEEEATGRLVAIKLESCV